LDPNKEGDKWNIRIPFHDLDPHTHNSNSPTSSSLRQVDQLATMDLLVAQMMAEPPVDLIVGYP
jgi:hypothetical protein